MSLDFGYHPLVTWDDVLRIARLQAPGSGTLSRPLYYRAPLDPMHHVANVLRVYRNGKVRINAGAVTFTADSGHLDRFRILGSPCTGYDGRAYGVGDRVELHPATDLWMRGARYGEVTALASTPRDRVRVRLDIASHEDNWVAGSEDTFRRIPERGEP